MGNINQIELPNNQTYDIEDTTARSTFAQYRRLDDPNYDTINVTELSSGNIINTGSARFLNTIYGDISGTSSNVTGTVAIANGGTGATSRLDALKALTNEKVGTDATYLLTTTDSWGKGGYSSVADVKTVLGLKSAAYTESSEYLASTTKYAASSSVGGAATSANKLTTARTITLAGDFTGSANFDGSGNISINTYFYHSQCNSSNKSNYPWHRFAYRENITGTYNDTDVIFEIRRKYKDGPYGRFKVSFRTNASGNYASGSITWLYRYGFDLDDVQMAYWGTTGQAVYVDLFVKCSTYARTTIYQIEGDRQFTLVTSNEVADTTASDRLTSTEVYKTIEEAGTMLHEQAYGTIKSGVDGAIVDYANSAGSATQDGDGNTITSTYLPLAGGTMTGTLIAKPSQYEDSYSGALNMSNSNIYGVNSIYTADSAGGASEGIHFYRDATHVDTLWMNDGDLLFVPNRELGVTTSKANSQKVGRFTANPTSGQVVITDGDTGGMKSSGYTIATSVPENALFTDTDHTYNLTSTNDSLQIVTGTSGNNTIWDVSVVKVNGHTVNEDVPSDAIFTDQNVYQSATSTSNWRKIVLSHQGDASAGTAVTAETDRVYVTPNVEIQPSTGTMRSTGNMLLNGSLTLGGNITNTSGVRQVYNSTTNSLDFVFVT